ncbi:hypothetical protein [Corallococcus sicarius]|uniref:hypothetical protein n=1 Tax=Corallococcus sicarius TaxID=2316726 RepID=UPI001315A8DD|nr:hypothetical protein [Corallococcus sicarius]
MIECNARQEHRGYIGRNVGLEGNYMGGIPAVPESVELIDGALAKKKEELAGLLLELEIAEAKSKLLHARQVWWRSGRTVTAIIGMLAAIVPVTSGIQGLIQKEREAATTRDIQQLEARERYLNTVLKDPHNAAVVLRFIIATSDDSRVARWADIEKDAIESRLGEINRRRAALYLETIDVVAKLAKSPSLAGENADLVTFWRLYNSDLLAVESPEVEELMVQMGNVIKNCGAGECDRANLQRLAFRIAHEMKGEIRAAAAYGP